jgi:hypothetical protein
VKLDQATVGFITGVSGVVTFPVDGKWLLQVYRGCPGYDKSVSDSQVWPTQSTGVPDPGGSIVMTFNVVQQIWTHDLGKPGQKLFSRIWLMDKN